MSKHVNAIGVLRLGLAAVGVLLVVMVYFGTRWLLTFPEVIEDRMAASVLTTVGNALVVVVSIGTALNLIAGLGLLAYQGWARYLAMILSIFDLFNLPVGTAVGLYTLWVLMHDDVIRHFGANLAYPSEKLARQS